MIFQKAQILLSLSNKILYKNSSTHLVTKTLFEKKPAKLFSLYQKSTKPDVHNNLVVLHGLFGSHTNFRSVTMNPLISNQVNTYLLDLRNHGLSEHTDSMSLQDMGADLVNFLEQNNVRNAILMGHSMGGRAIMSAMQYYGSSLDPYVKAAIICDIAPGNLVQARTADLMEMWVMIHKLLDIDFHGKDRTKIDKEVRAIIPNPQVAGFMMMNVIPDEQNPGQYKWRVNLKAIRDYYKQNLGTEIKDANFLKPSFVICGARSHYINQSKISEFGNVFPNIDYDRDVYFIKGAGHWLHADKPVEFIDKVSEFLTRVH
ncbi:hypothetical protein ABPG74_015362 [Tetrahymena malaccensis]